MELARRMQNREIITLLRPVKKTVLRFPLVNCARIIAKEIPVRPGFQCDLAKKREGGGRGRKNEADERHIFSRMHPRRRYFPIDSS